MKEFQDAIRAAREASGLNQKEFAAQLGVSSVCIHRWEIGRFLPDLPHLEILRDFIDHRLVQKLMKERLTYKPKPHRHVPWLALGEKIRAARLRAGLTRKQVAAQVGVQDDSIAGWERGESSPREEHFRKLAKVLELPDLQEYRRLALKKPQRGRLADAIRAARQNTGLSQRELAKRMGVSYISILLWENGRVSIRRPNILKLAAVLNAPGLLTVYHNVFPNKGLLNTATGERSELRQGPSGEKLFDQESALEAYVRARKVQGAVEMGRALGVSKAEVAKKIASMFDMPLREAQRVVQRYWEKSEDDE